MINNGIDGIYVTIKPRIYATAYTCIQARKPTKTNKSHCDIYYGLEICHKTNFYKFLVFIYFWPNQSCHNVALWRTSKVVSKE